MASCLSLSLISPQVFVLSIIYLSVNLSTYQSLSESLISFNLWFLLLLLCSFLYAIHCFNFTLLLIPLSKFDFCGTSGMWPLSQMPMVTDNQFGSFFLKLCSIKTDSPGAVRRLRDDTQDYNNAFARMVPFRKTSWTYTSDGSEARYLRILCSIKT